MSESILSYTDHIKRNSELFKELLFTGKYTMGTIKRDLSVILDISDENHKDLITNYRNNSLNTHSRKKKKYTHNSVCEPYFITIERNKEIKELSLLCNVTEPNQDYNPISLREWLNKIKSYVGILSIKKYVITNNVKKGHGKKRKTCRAHFNMLSHKKFKESNQITQFNNYKNRIKVIKLLSMLEGRMRYYYSSWMNNKAHLIAQFGLTHFELNNHINSKYGSWYEFIKKYPLTSMFMIFYLKEIKRVTKPKIVHSKEQLHRSLTLIFEQIIKNESECIDVLAFMLPIEEVYQYLSQSFCKQIYEKTTKWLHVLAAYIEKEWTEHKILYRSWSTGFNLHVKLI